MNKNRLKQLTFGFELEGNFSDSLAYEPGQFKEDGSVSDSFDCSFDPVMIGSEESEDCSECEGNGYIYEDCECEANRLECSDRGSHTSNLQHTEDCYVRSCDQDSDYHRVDCNYCHGDGTIGGDGESPAQEYASPKYLDLGEMLKALSKFKKSNHVYDESCGFHLHIGLKNNHWRMLYNAVSSYDFLMSIHHQAQTWCPCLNDRLNYQEDLYFQTWKNPRDLIKTFNGEYQERNFHGDSLKYRFMRYHKELRTLEFRFLCPCEHKCANVEKLVGLLTDYLNQETKLVVEQEATINPPQKAVLNITLKSSTWKEKESFYLNPYDKVIKDLILGADF